MADHSTIEWTDATWNPITGCAVVSPGCTNCYAMKLAGTRLKHHPSRAGLTRDTKAGPVWNGEVRLNEDWLLQPLQWKRPRHIFVCAHGDLFAEQVPDAWIMRVLFVMGQAPQHIFQVLTKRPERMRAFFRKWADMKPASIDDLCTAQTPDEVRKLYDCGRGHLFADMLESMGTPPPGCGYPLFDWMGGMANWPDALPNVWLGVSVEDQARADERIPVLLDTPAAIRWISDEPMLGRVDLRAWLPNAWKCKGEKRPWSSFDWPKWVPEETRNQVMSFWSNAYGRDPNDWMRGALENGQPPLGTFGTYKLLDAKQSPIEGRFVPAWNNIGRVVTDSGEVRCVSAGLYQSHPPRLDWVVAGGESGPDARAMHPDWPRALRDQCAAAGVAFFFKQWGNWRPATWKLEREEGETDKAYIARSEAEAATHAVRSDSGFSLELSHRPWSVERASEEPTPFAGMRPCGKSEAGRLLDGATHDAMPGRKILA